MRKLLSSLFITFSVLGSSIASAEVPNVEFYFTQEDQHPEDALINIINSANSSIDMAIYTITKDDIVDAVIDAVNRGVSVRIITDKAESKTKSESAALSRLLNANIPIKINSHPGLMHEKVTIADNAVVTTGSYNYSKAATTINDEVLVVIRDSDTANTFEGEFTRMWEDTKKFKDYSVE